MSFDRSEFKPSLRDVLISKVQHGELTPQQAEAEAAANGLPPFERTPDLAKYDPLTESRWTLVMAVAWIAWRDIRRVQESGAEFRSESTLWRYREWNKPTDGGTKFSLQKGWFLESWSEPTTIRLAFLEIIERQKRQLPHTTCMSVGEAEKDLWRALSEGQLVAEALDDHGKPVDIPQREWSYLKLFEDGKRDVLKYEPLDRNEPFTNLKLKRDDVRSLWPEVRTISVDVETLDLGSITPEHISAMHSGESHVPLCVAIAWVATKGGSSFIEIRNDVAWQRGAKDLLQRVASGKIEVIGRACDDDIDRELPCVSFSRIRVLPLAPTALTDISLTASSYIDCEFSDSIGNCDDRLFQRGQPHPTWTRIALKRTDVLQYWPVPPASNKGELGCREWLKSLMMASPAEKTKPKAAFLTEAQMKFAKLGPRRFNAAWARAIEETGATAWGRAGAPKKN